MKKFVFISTLLAAVFSLAAADNYVPPTEDLLPEVEVFPQKATRARWLWYQAPHVKEKSPAFYRMTIFLSEPVKEAYCLLVVDDSGVMFVNGASPKRLPYKNPMTVFSCRKYDLTSHLKVGKNVLAFQVHNDLDLGGIIMTGQIKTISGKTIRIFSDPDKIKAYDRETANWNQVNFDDRKWQKAMSVGNAYDAPWMRVDPHIWDIFGTEQEKKLRRQRELETISGVPDLSKETPAQAKVVYCGDMAALDINGKIMPPLFHMVNNAVWSPKVADAMVKSYRSGVRLIWHAVHSDMIYDPVTGKYDFSVVDKDIRRILTLCPDAYIAITLRHAYLPKEWAAKYPDELIAYASGKAPSPSEDQISNFRAASSGSMIYRQHFSESMRELAKFAKSHEWGKRVVAMRIGFGVYNEWHYYGMENDMPDTSPAMTRYFRNYLKDKYKTDAALAAAWHTPGVTLATAAVPDSAERHGDGLYLRDPSTVDQKVMDYYECHQHAVATMLLDAAGEVKKVSPNWLVGAYYGYVFHMPYPSEGQTLLLDKVLSSPNIDFLSAPYGYGANNRRAGGTGAHRHLPDKFRAYGKLALLEMDVRTHKAIPSTPFAVIKTENDSVSVLERDFSSAWIAGCGVQLLDLEAITSPRNNSWFNSPGIQLTIHRTLKRWQELLQQNLRDQYDAVAIWHIDENILHGRPVKNKNSQLTLALSDHTLNAILRSGYAFDLKDIDEYLSSKHSYKLAFFMNAFTLTDEQRTAIKNKLAQDNTHAVFIYGAGAVRSNGLSADNVTDITDIKVTMQTQPRSFAAQYLNGKPARSLSGKTLETPSFTVKDNDAETLAFWQDTKAPAAARKRLTDGRNIWYFAFPIKDSEPIAEICNAAGLHRYTDVGTLMRTNGNIMLVHGGNDFSQQIKFPTPLRKITDLYTGEIIAENTDTVNLQSQLSRSWVMRLGK